MEDETSLPYNGSSGWSGQDSSKARADHADGTGLTTVRQRSVVRLLGHRGRGGATWREVATELELHHGQASGVLSNLHKTGRIAMLRESRARCHVYVLPMYVLDRETLPHGGKKKTAHDNATTEELINALLIQQELERKMGLVLTAARDQSVPPAIRLRQIEQILT